MSAAGEWGMSTQDGGRSRAEIPLPSLDANGPLMLTLQMAGLPVLQAWG